MYKVEELFDLTHTRAAEYLKKFMWPHEALSGIKPMIEALGAELPKDEFEHPAPHVWIARDAVVAPTACLGEYVIIDHGAEVRHCAYIRGSALIGCNTVVGNSTELKNVILFDNVQVPHYNYVGDSILGYHAHMGAGAVTSNVKGDRTLVVIRDGSETLETNLKKMGAMLGDWAEIGCNSVLNPGTIIGRNAQVYPLTSVRGTVPANCIHKGHEIVEKHP
ncbi:MAG: UDP-N-acetylglucosamine pyrophosphorylase [Clostridia bacterium]|jgi:NDP-sugar pyrophosphorylase family protein|nr:UDP-N-acetylglucosamine pyrophosphorylase [Clostridia bacterium]